MSRPLSGSIKPKPNGTFEAGVPTARGSRQRKTATFAVRAEAQRWIDACVAALHAGHPLPDPAEFRSGQRPAAVTMTPFIRSAEIWIREYYVEDGNGDIGREDQVRRYATVIDDYLGERGLHVETTTRQHARTMYRDLKAPPMRPDPARPDGLDLEELVTARQAGALLAEHGWNSSESSLKRARATGRLKPSGKRGGAFLFRVGDVFDPTGGGLAPTRGPHLPQYAHTTLQDLRWVFTSVLAHAKLEGIAVQPGVRRANLPKDKTRKPKTRSLSLKEMGGVAGHLHVVHQLALFLCRLLGLRIGEAYGLRVEDVIDMGPGEPGLLTVQSQGGRKFKTRAPDGTVETTDEVDETKRDSWRILVVPARFMDVIRTVIECFHLDADGAWRPEARLIPGLEHDDVGGQSAFRTALKSAAAREGIDLEIDEGRRGESGKGRQKVQVTPQSMRQSFATALQASREIVENIRTVMGHRKGAEVIHLHYFLEDPEMQPQRDVAVTLQNQIEADFPDGLLIPTTTRCTTGTQPALAKRAAEIDSVLMDLGWQVDEPPGGDWITVVQASEIRGVTPTQIRDDIADDKLTATQRAQGTNDRYSYLVAAPEVIAMAERLGHSGSDMGQLAEELAVPYDRIRQYARRNLDLAPRSGRAHRLTEEQAGAVRAYFGEQQALAERAVALPEVCNELGLSVAALNTIIKHGRLVEDIRMHGGIRTITKHSLAEYRCRPGRKRHAL